MRRPWFRPLFCILIIVALFIPSYRGFSAFDFILIAFSETGAGYGLNSTDAFVATSPLILIPVTAIIISVRSFLKLPTSKIFTMLPLLLVLFFMTIIVNSEVKEDDSVSGIGLLSQIQIGFYIALLFSVLLPFTRNHRRKKVRKQETTQAQVAL